MTETLFHWLRWAARRFVALVTSPRYGVMTVVVLASFLLWDRLFPFSSFPMYSNFPDRTYYVYIADGEGTPLPLHDLFGYRTTKLKRIFNGEMKGVLAALDEEGSDEAEMHLVSAESLRPAGDATLKWLVENDRRRKKKEGNPPPKLQLVQVEIELHGTTLEKKERVVGLYPPDQP